MIPLFGIVGTILGLAALYALAAALVCLELNLDEHHWWCPLCQLTRIFTRRWTL